MKFPEGWKLVPVEPTPEMLHDASEVDLEEETPEAYQAYLRAIYCRAIAAAPTPPAQDDYPPRMKREDDCMTLQDWRIRAMNLEASWANCSQACARIQGQRDEALEMLRSLAMAIERRQSLVGSHAWKQAHDTFLDAMERARALLTKRGAA